jgi:hypothetical protein
VDDADRAQNDIELRLAAAINAPRSNLSPRGKCYNCDNETGDEVLFCDRECRDDFEKRKAAMALVGRWLLP